MARTIRVDEEVFTLIRSNKREGESDSTTVARMLAEAAAAEARESLGVWSSADTLAQPFEV